MVTYFQTEVLSLHLVERVLELAFGNSSTVTAIDLPCHLDCVVMASKIFLVFVFFNFA